LEGYFLIILDN